MKKLEMICVVPVQDPEPPKPPPPPPPKEGGNYESD